MPRILRAALQKGAVMGDVYAAISADQAVNLAPPDSPSPFLISNPPRREKQPKGYSGSSLQPGRRDRGGAGERQREGEEEGERKNALPNACFLLHNFQMRISSLINAN